jgi:ribosomal protein S18 acetylase RimI-like enzyme
VTADLRPARPEDAPQIAKIWHLGWRDGHLGHVPQTLVAARTPESFRTRAADLIAETVVAEAAGEVAGFVIVTGAEVEQVYVAARHRGTGIAPQLLEEAERIVAAGGHEEAWLAVVAGNKRARRFYQRLGWADGGPFTHRAPNGAETIPVPAHRYVKRLQVGSGM